MALQHSYTKFGVEFTTAYSKIMSISYHSRNYPETTITEEGEAITTLVPKNEIDYTVEVYPTAADREANKEVMGRHSFSFEPDWSTETNTVVTQCYEHAKTQPQFTGAIDA